MLSNNVEGFRQILDLAVSWGSRVIWASSASIYGNSAAPNVETQPPAPLNVYAFSKMKMEHLADGYRPRLVQPIIGLRYFNVYGPGEDHKCKFASMIHQLAKQMRQGQRPSRFCIRRTEARLRLCRRCRAGQPEGHELRHRRRVQRRLRPGEIVQ